MNKITITLSALLLVFLASCGEQKHQSPTNQLVVGMVQHVKLFSENFSLELIDVKDGVAVWKGSWGENMHFKQKILHNIFPVWSDSQKPSYYNKFDHEKLDKLFPLEVGKVVSFGGESLVRNNTAPQAFWAVIEVLAKEKIQLEGVEHEVFKIKISTETKGKTAITKNVRYLWFSPEVGLSLKVVQIVNNQKHSSQVIKIEYPDQFRPEFKNVGTTRINFEKEQEKEIELYEAKLQLSGF